MIDPNHQPPAIVRGAASVNERVHKARDLERQIKEAEHFTLGLGIEQGRELLALKEQCAREQIDWLPILEKIGVAERTAQRRMVIATYVVQHPTDCRISDCGSLQSAYEYVAEQTPPARSNGVSTYGTTSDPLKCERHNRTGGGGSQCKKCAALMRKAAKKEAALAEARGDPVPDREPGDDTEAEAAAAAAERAKGKNGKPVIDWKKFDRDMSAMAAWPGALYRLAGLTRQHAPQFEAGIKEDPPYKRLVGLLEEFVEGFRQRYEEITREKPPQLPTHKKEAPDG